MSANGIGCTATPAQVAQVMCVMREHTGAIWITILMHMAKNGLAFYLLFVNPQIVEQIKAAILPLL
jgi:membrane protease YdiL (CAAX protease family)